MMPVIGKTTDYMCTVYDDGYPKSCYIVPRTIDQIFLELSSNFAAYGAYGKALQGFGSGVVNILKHLLEGIDLWEMEKVYVAAQQKAFIKPTFNATKFPPVHNEHYSAVAEEALTDEDELQDVDNVIF